MPSFTDLTIAQLADLIRSGAPVAVTCKKAIEDNEGYAEAGMRAVLVHADTGDAEVPKITLDFAPFDEYNKQFETANYYDANGNATLTAREKGSYKLREVYYFDAGQLASTVFEPVDTAQQALQDEYRSTVQTDQSYVSWLEQQVLALRQRT